MSVPLYNRSLSELQFWKTAADLRKNISIWMRNEMKNPDWLEEDARKRIMDAMASMTSNISNANAFYPSSKEMLDSREYFQTAAIAAVQRLMDELTFLADIMKGNVGMIACFISEAEKEISLLKGWRRKGRDILKKELERKNSK